METDEHLGNDPATRAAALQLVSAATGCVRLGPAGKTRPGALVPAFRRVPGVGLRELRSGTARRGSRRGVARFGVPRRCLPAGPRLVVAGRSSATGRSASEPPHPADQTLLPLRILAPFARGAKTPKGSKVWLPPAETGAAHPANHTRPDCTSDCCSLRHDQRVSRCSRGC